MTTTTLSTLLGPLTTTYTPSGSICNSIHYDTNPTPPGWFVLGAIGPDSTSCMPAGYTRVPQYYYSPGVCPSGYTPACSSIGTTYSSATTVATCCPTGYVCFQNRGDNIYGCTSLVTEALALTILSVDFETSTVSSRTVNAVSSGEITTTLTALKESIQAYGVIVQRQSTDPPFVATTTTTSGTTSGTGTSTSSIASSTSTITPSEESSSGLSSGAKAGVGVGVAVGAIAIIALCFFFFRMRRRAARVGDAGGEVHTEQGSAAAPNQAWEASPQPEYNANAAQEYKQEPQQYTTQQYTPHEYTPQQYAPQQHEATELLAQHRAQELPGEQERRSELPADRFR